MRLPEKKSFRLPDLSSRTRTRIPVSATGHIAVVTAAGQIPVATVGQILATVSRGSQYSVTLAPQSQGPYRFAERIASSSLQILLSSNPNPNN